MLKMLKKNAKVQIFIQFENKTIDVVNTCSNNRFGNCLPQSVLKSPCDEKRVKITPKN